MSKNKSGQKIIRETNIRRIENKNMKNKNQKRKTTLPPHNPLTHIHTYPSAPNQKKKKSSPQQPSVVRKKQSLSMRGRGKEGKGTREERRGRRGEEEEQLREDFIARKLERKSVMPLQQRREEGSPMLPPPHWPLGMKEARRYTNNRPKEKKRKMQGKERKVTKNDGLSKGLTPCKVDKSSVSLKRKIKRNGVNA